MPHADPVTSPSKRFDVAELLDRAAEVAATCGEPDMAAVLRAAQQRLRTARLDVMIAGEAQSGKSRLLNAMLGMRGLSPVGDLPTTGCPVTFTHAATVAARVVTSAVDETGSVRLTAEDVPVERVADLVTTSSPTTTSAEVRLPHPLLTGAAIVDTPGLSGLSPVRRQMILDALRSTDVLLFVTAAGRPLGGPELAFLRRAAQTVAAIAVVLTKIDLYPAYAEVLHADKEILAQEPLLAPVPILAVSAATAELAAQRSEPAIVELLRKRADVDAVVELVRALASGGTPRVKATNALRLVDAAVRQLRRAAQRRPAAAPDRRSELRQRHAELRARTDDETTLLAEVRVHLSRMRVQPRHRLDGAVTDLRHRFRNEAATCPPVDLESLPARFQAEVATAVQDGLGELAGELSRLAGRLAQQLGYDELDAFLAETISEAEVLGSFEDSDLYRSKTQSAMSMLPGLRVGALVAAPTGLLATLGIAAVAPLAPIALGVAAAVGIGWWTNKATSTQARRVHLRGWVDSACGEVRGMFARVVEERVLAVQEHVDVELPRLVRRRREELREVDAEWDALARADDEERGRRTAEHERRLALINELAAAVDATRAGLAHDGAPHGG